MIRTLAAIVVLWLAKIFERFFPKKPPSGFDDGYRK